MTLGLGLWPGAFWGPKVLIKAMCFCLPLCAVGELGWGMGIGCLRLGPHGPSASTLYLIHSFIHSTNSVAVCQGLCSDVRDHENRTDSGLPLERGHHLVTILWGNRSKLGDLCIICVLVYNQFIKVTNIKSHFP